MLAGREILRSTQDDSHAQQSRRLTIVSYRVVILRSTQDDSHAQGEERGAQQHGEYAILRSTQDDSHAQGIAFATCPQL